MFDRGALHLAARARAAVPLDANQPRYVFAKRDFCGLASLSTRRQIDRKGGRAQAGWFCGTGACL
jgi:hypothetical protein